MKNKREIAVFWFLILIGLTSFSWLNFDLWYGDNMVINTNPKKSGLGVEETWAIPDLENNKKHPSQPLGYTMYPPVGFSEIVIIPEHRERCVKTVDNDYLCTWIDDNGKSLGFEPHEGK